jgi:hypothetical protein
VELVGAGRVDPEQLPLGDRDQIVALISLLVVELVVGEGLSVGDGFLQAVDLGGDAGLGKVPDLAVILMAALSDREARVGLEGRFDEVVDEAIPVTRLGGSWGSSRIVLWSIRNLAAAQGQSGGHCRRQQ